MSLTKRKRAMLENLFFSMVLFLYPLRNIAKGIDITDTGYSLGNFQYISDNGNMWFFATYFANRLGKFMMQLPFGNTMMGMNLYSGLLISLLGIVTYFFASNCIPRYIVFIGELIAISLCWCPTVILYNYITYVLFDLAVIFLFIALIKEKKVFFVLAGFLLGLSVMTRFPNILEVTLIIGVWYFGYLKKKLIKQVIFETFLCFAGFATGITAILCSIALQYGISPYATMVKELVSLGNTGQSGYSFFEMLKSILNAYQKAAGWSIYFIAYLMLGLVTFFITEKFMALKNLNDFKMKKIIFLAGEIVYTIGFILLIVLLHRRGMFVTRYYIYESMFQWVAILILYVIFLCWTIIINKSNQDNIAEIQKKLFAVFILIIIGITPLGSNNYLYPVINNMFLIMPFSFYIIFELGKKLIHKKNPIFFPLIVLIFAFHGMVIIQSLGFGMNFIFRDGTNGEKRDTVVTQNNILNGMHSSAEKVADIEEISLFFDTYLSEEQEALFFGDVPGMSYYLQLKPAISTSWPELDSYTTEQFEKELSALKGNVISGHRKPVVIVSSEVAVWLNKDEKGSEQSDLIKSKYSNDDKSILFRSILSSMEYREVFSNRLFSVYQ